MLIIEKCNQKRNIKQKISKICGQDENVEQTTVGDSSCKRSEKIWDLNFLRMVCAEMLDIHLTFPDVII